MLTSFLKPCQLVSIKDSSIQSSTRVSNWPWLNFEKRAKSSLVFLVSLYRSVGSLFLGGNCRFYPSCSEYALQALDQHSASRAVGLIAHRLCRCHPWGDSGYDPVPIELREAHGTAKK